LIACASDPCPPDLTNRYASASITP
jgi:hypothetical protein